MSLCDSITTGRMNLNKDSSDTKYAPLSIERDAQLSIEREPTRTSCPYGKHHKFVYVVRIRSKRRLKPYHEFFEKDVATSKGSFQLSFRAAKNDCHFELSIIMVEPIIYVHHFELIIMDKPTDRMMAPAIV